MSDAESKDARDGERHQMISFRADDEVVAVLRELEAAVGGGVSSARVRSVAIRRAILEAGERLRSTARAR